MLAKYDYVFPDGKSINGGVAEVWKIKDGKLDALTIFFDTLLLTPSARCKMSIKGNKGIVLR